MHGGQAKPASGCKATGAAACVNACVHPVKTALKSLCDGNRNQIGWKTR